MTFLKCNNCGWAGTVDEIVEYRKDGSYNYKGCPVYGTNKRAVNPEKEKTDAGDKQ